MPSFARNVGTIPSTVKSANLLICNIDMESCHLNASYVTRKHLPYENAESAGMRTVLIAHQYVKNAGGGFAVRVIINTTSFSDSWFLALNRINHME